MKQGLLEFSRADSSPAKDSIIPRGLRKQKPKDIVAIMPSLSADPSGNRSPLLTILGVGRSGKFFLNLLAIRAMADQTITLRLLTTAAGTVACLPRPGGWDSHPVPCS
jgi:hypothetical protein